MQYAKSLMNLARDKGKELQQEIESRLVPLQQQVPLLALNHGSGTGAAAAVGTSPHCQQTSSAQSLESRVHDFKQVLLASKIDLTELRRLAFHGIPDKDGVRAITWKVRHHRAIY